MAKKQQPSLDGFILRRHRPSTPNSKSGLVRPTIPQQFLRSNETAAARPGPASRSEVSPSPQLRRGERQGLSRSEIDASLSAVDETVKRKVSKRSRSKVTKKIVVTMCVLVLCLGVGFFAFKALMAASRVVSGNVFDLLGKGVELKKDANGRTNILLFGTSEDDPGHAGAELTDSILVLSINKADKTAAMVSMPRDMWVNYDLSPCCWTGCSGKINALYQCNATNGDVAKGANALKDKVGEVFGLDVQYYVKVNYAVVRQLTTALGGVTVTIEGDPSFGGTKGIYDSNMGKLLKLPNGPATLQGEQALAFVRARGEGYGSYGLNGNFSREQNQQKMIIAIRDKALNIGTLSNPVALISLMDALGDNVRTNFTTAEVKTLASLGKDISGDKVQHVELNSTEKPVVTTGMYSGQSIVRPIAGLSDFSDIQKYIKGKLSGDEDATIVVLNASGRVGVASQEAEVLTGAGFSDVTTDNTAYRLTTALAWYDLSGGKKTKTRSKLVKQLGVDAVGTKLPVGVQATADFVILVGNGTH